MAGAFRKRVLLLLRQGFNNFGGRAHDQRAIRDFLVFGDQTVGTNQAVPANFGAVENDGVDADQGVISDAAAMQHDFVSDGDIFTNYQRKSIVRMQHGAVLNIGVFSDANQFTVAPENRVEPDAGIVFQSHGADNRGVVGDKIIIPDHVHPFIRPGYKA